MACSKGKIEEMSWNTETDREEEQNYTAWQCSHAAEETGREEGESIWCGEFVRKPTADKDNSPAVILVVRKRRQMQALKMVQGS